MDYFSPSIRIADLRTSTISSGPSCDTAISVPAQQMREQIISWIDSLWLNIWAIYNFDEDILTNEELDAVMQQEIDDIIRSISRLWNNTFI